MFKNFVLLQNWKDMDNDKQKKNTTTAPINGFVEAREQETARTQKDMADMPGISPVICRQAGVASIYLFPKHISLNWSIKMKGRIPDTQFMRWNQSYKQTFCLYLYNMLFNMLYGT